MENLQESAYQFDIDFGKICFSNQPNEFDKALYIVSDKIIKSNNSNDSELNNKKQI